MTETAMNVRIERLRGTIANFPGTVRDEPAGEPLYQAVHGLAAADVADPGRLARELAGRPDPVLRAEAFRIVREALHADRLPPADARALVDDLAADVPGALRELAEPWAALDPLPSGRVLRYLASGPDDAAIDVAARHGHRDLLRGVAAGPERPPRVRQRALELLGDLATRDDIPDLLAVAGTDPELLAAPAVACLTGLHRRGHFPGDDDVPSVLRLALADHRVPVEDVAIVLYTSRHAALRDLVGCDEDVSRRLDLLIALDAQGGPGLDVGGTVTDLVRRAADPVPYLRALRALRHAASEETVIGLLPGSPAAALDTLEAIGDARTADVLWTGLGLDGGEIVPHLRADRHRALEILWHLTGDPARRRAILDRLDPRDLPRRIADDLGGSDPRELAVLAANPDPDDPVDALCRLARNGDATSLPAISDLLLRVVSDLAATWGEGPEPAVQYEALEAIRGLGGRLYRRGAVRPRCLLDAADERGAGDGLLTTMALDLLDRPGLSPAEQAILLDLPARDHRTRARVHPLLRHRDRHVRKKAIALLAGGDARTLSASLTPLTAVDDPQTVRQAVRALGEAGATWAAPAIAACLDHPNMNVKKAAATALATAGSPGVVPALLSWLGRHDNPGLQEEITAALRAILGGAYAATVRAAADRTDDARARTRLLSALPARRPPSPAAWLAEHGWAPEVARRAVTACNDRPDRLRAMLPHWLALLADADPGAAVLRFVLALGHGRWSDTELETFARSAPTLVDALPTLEGPDRTRLLKLLDEVIPRTGPASRRALAARLRDMPRSRDVFTLLCRCAVPTRDDLTGALEAARESSAEAETAVLQEAFARASPDAPAELVTTIRGSVRSIEDVQRLRGAAVSGGPSLDAPAEFVSVPGETVRSAEDVQRLRAAAVSDRPLPSAPAEFVSALGETVRSLEGVQHPRATAAADSVDEGTHPVFDAPGASVRSAERADPRTNHEMSTLVGAASGDGGTADGTGEAERARKSGWSSREWLDALIEAFPVAAPEVRDDLLDWMLDLQPLGLPPWTLGEEARRVPEKREPRLDDLDQPWSAARRERLLRMLEDGTDAQRKTAARVLLDRPEPAARLPVLRAYLDGRIESVSEVAIARVLRHAAEPVAASEDGVLGERPARCAAPDAGRFLPSPASIRAVAERGGGEAFSGRLVRLIALLDADDLERFVPLVVEVWEHGRPTARADALQALRRASADLVAAAIADRVEAGEWGMLDLVAGRPVLRTPVLTKAVERLRADGRDDLADRLDLVDGPFRGPGAAERDAAALADLRERRPAPPEPSRAELLAQARTGTAPDVRRALTRLAEQARTPDPELADLLGELLRHRDRKVKLQALRVSRQVLPRPEYLDRTVALLDDRDSDVVLTAIRTLAHAEWAPAVPGLVALLEHSRPVVARDARSALVRLGERAIPALRHAEGRARPDRRHVYTRLVERIQDEQAEWS